MERDMEASYVAPIGADIPALETNVRAFAEARYLFLNTPRITAINGMATTELISVTIRVAGNVHPYGAVGP